MTVSTWTLIETAPHVSLWSLLGDDDTLTALANEGQLARVVAVIGPPGVAPAVRPEDFGAFANGTTNDLQAFHDAAAYLGDRGGIIMCGPKKYRLTGGNLELPKGVVIQGQSPSAGLDAYNWDQTSVGTCLLIDGAYTINCDYNTGVMECWIVRYGLTEAQSEAEATAGLAAFTGTAISIIGSDVTLEYLSITGFNKAIHHKGTDLAGYERQRISWVMFDCINGIQMDVSGDLGYIHKCRGFPFYTAFRPWSTDALKIRSGIAFYSSGTHDWGEWMHCNSYGWQTGFLINNSNNVTLTNCGADTIQGTAGSKGLVLDGTCQAFTAENFKSTCETGYEFDFTGHAALIGCQAWGCENFVNVIAGDVSSYGSFWHYMATAGATFPWIVGVGAGYVTLHGDVFDNSASTYPGDPFSVHATAQSKFRLKGIRLKSATTTQIDQVASDWTTWVPTITSGTGTLTTVTLGFARYQTIGKTVYFSLFFTITDNGTGATDIRVTAPGTVGSAGVCAGRNLGTGAMLQAQIIASGLNQFRIFRYDNAYPVATGNGVVLSGSYETS